MKTKKVVNIIAACSTNKVIGIGGKLPWRIEEDFRYFKRMIAGGVYIAGRGCYEEAGLVCAGDNIVLSRNPHAHFPGAMRAPSLSEAIDKANQLAGDRDIWIGGGETVFEEAFPIADRLYLTVVHDVVTGDRFFPDSWNTHFKNLLTSRHSSDGRYNYTFNVYGK